MMDWMHDVLIPECGQDAAYGRLTDLASYRIPVHSDRVHHLDKRLKLLDLDNIEQVRTTEVEMRADIVADAVSRPCHLRFEQTGQKRHTASAPCPCLRPRLHVADILCTFAYAADNIPFADVVARADLCVVIQVCT